MKLLLDVKGLAQALSLSPLTVQQNASRHPEKLPPRIDIGSRKLLWAVADVEAWIEQRREKKPGGEPGPD